MKVLFVCKNNQFRSQMAAAIYNKITKTNDADSVGTYVGSIKVPEGDIIEKYFRTTDFFELMEKNGMNIRNNRTKKLLPEMINSADIVISMAKEPFVPAFLCDNKKVVCWEVEDPAFVTCDVAEKTFNQLKSLIEQLISRGVHSGQGTLDGKKKVIFNHFDSELRKIQMIQQVGLNGLEVYSGRSLCLSEPCDVVQLDPKLKTNWGWIGNHYSKIGLSHATQIVWDNSFKVLRDFHDHDISVFIFSKEINMVRENYRWLEIVRQMNSKNQFIKTCQKLRVPAPKTWLFSSKDEIAEYSFHFPIYLKAANSVSGLGVARCINQKDIELHLSTMSAGDFQIQEEIEESAFLNLTYAVCDGKLEKIASTRQILSGFSHNGNVFPSGKDDPWYITDPIAQYLFQEGMLGVFGFDVAVTPSGYFAIECNPRFNASVYPAVIAKKLDIKKWLATNVTTKESSLNNMQLGAIEYNQRTKKGVVVVNWGAVMCNKIGVLVAADTSEEQNWYIDELKSILS